MPPKHTRSTRNTTQAAAEPPNFSSSAKRSKNITTTNNNTLSTRKSARTSAPTPPSSKPPIGRPTNLSPPDSEIARAFSLFALSRSDVSDRDALSDDGHYDDDEREDDYGNSSDTVIRISDVRRAMNACDLPTPPADFFEEEQRYLSWNNFRELARTLRDVRGMKEEDEEGEEEEGEEEEGEDDEEEDEEEAGGFSRPATARNSKPKPKAASSTTNRSKVTKSRQPSNRNQALAAEELSHAFSLFTHSTTRSTITLQDLRRVAKELREDVDDKILMLMIEEANGEVGRESVGRGVGMGEFEGVMRRAGLFG